MGATATFVYLPIYTYIPAAPGPHFFRFDPFLGGDYAQTARRLDVFFFFWKSRDLPPFEASSGPFRHRCAFLAKSIGPAGPHSVSDECPGGELKLIRRAVVDFNAVSNGLSHFFVCGSRFNPLLNVSPPRSLRIRNPR